MEFASEPDGEYVIIAFCPAHLAEFSHERLAPETDYFYRVRSFVGPACEPVEVALPRELTDAEYEAAYAKPEDYDWAIPHRRPVAGPIKTRSIAEAAGQGAEREVDAAAPGDVRAALVRSTVSGFVFTWTDRSNDEDGFLLEKVAGRRARVPGVRVREARHELVRLGVRAARARRAVPAAGDSLGAAVERGADDDRAGGSSDAAGGGEPVTSWNESHRLCRWTPQTRGRPPAEPVAFIGPALSCSPRRSRLGRLRHTEWMWLAGLPSGSDWIVDQLEDERGALHAIGVADAGLLGAEPGEVDAGRGPRRRFRPGGPRRARRRGGRCRFPKASAGSSFGRRSCWRRAGPTGGSCGGCGWPGPR